MKIWLDDYRPAPEGWIHVKTAADAITFLIAGSVDEISLDYDLGFPGDDRATTGYGVACCIARMARSGELRRIPWHLHSDHEKGRLKILRAMEQAEKYWLESEMVK